VGRRRLCGIQKGGPPVRGCPEEWLEPLSCIFVGCSRRQIRLPAGQHQSYYLPPTPTGGKLFGWCLHAMRGLFTGGDQDNCSRICPSRCHESFLYSRPSSAMETIVGCRMGCCEFGSIFQIELPQLQMIDLFGFDKETRPDS
jgi:hypothetical protein